MVGPIVYFMAFLFEPALRIQTSWFWGIRNPIYLVHYFAAGWLVKGSGSLARSLGVPPIVVGLTVVAFGTSAPELFVSLTSAVQDSPMIAVTNVIGSNICNIALVLGLSVLVRPVICDRSVRRRDIPLMLVISLVLPARIGGPQYPVPRET